MIDSIEYSAPLGKSYHSCLIFNLLCYTEYTKTSSTSYNLNKGDYNRFRAKLEERLRGLSLQELALEEMWTQIISALEEAMEECTPRTRWIEIHQGGHLG
jgi:hypothetical protein